MKSLVYRLFAKVALALVFTAAQLSSQAQAEPAAANKSRGVDVSHFQNKIRWDLVKPGSIDFVFVKASGGITNVDPEFGNNWNGAREAGLIRGAYHFYYAKDDPQLQAENFVRTVVRLKDEDLPPVLDVEISDGASKQELVEGVLVWLKSVEQKLGRRPMLYCPPKFADEFLNDARLADYELWIADYDVPAPVLPTIWKDKGWKFWQYTEQGTLDGVTGAVDFNVFSGSPNELHEFIRSYGASSATAVLGAK